MTEFLFPVANQYRCVSEKSPANTWSIPIKPVLKRFPCGFFLCDRTICELTKGRCKNTGTTFIAV